MSLFKTVDQLSLGKVMSLSLVLAIMVSVPVGVALVQRETRITSRAAYEKPSQASEPKSTPGPIPVAPPEIGRVYPWVGKIGDVVWVQGKDFGTNPETKSLSIGGVMITDEAIEAWEDTEIQSIIPTGARQGGVVEVSVGSHPVSQSLPFVLYDANTTTKLRKESDTISVEGASLVAKAIIWTGDDVIETEKHEVDITPVNGKAVVFETEGLPLLSIVLLDAAGKVVPYYVNPIEFGF